MATVTIRRLDDQVMAQLKRRARLQGRSLEAELREILMAAAAQDMTPADKWALFERLADGRAAA
ncbi:MAG: FitA-like ribbon-helix-helix domain-containing protein [Minwuia sp.]|uniref:FitA-like ribbon-helix-helix domain-containing protein n=1 Tax=Minwuia sp. TaxID=2493630 RepID=UPI003A83F332